MNRKAKRTIIPAIVTVLVLMGINVLFYVFGVKPAQLGGSGVSSAYALFLAILCFLDVPVVGYLAGYRKMAGFLYGYGITAAFQLFAAPIFGAPFYGIALWFPNWPAALRSLLLAQIVLTAGAFFLGKTLRRRGWGLSMPGEH